MIVLFSAHAEVFPNGATNVRAVAPLLRTRGGISFSPAAFKKLRLSSPHTRRYFPSKKIPSSGGSLFSAHAEVFPKQCATHKQSPTLLRTRGGISSASSCSDSPSFSSPHTRRYFQDFAPEPKQYQLFSAHAEVFPKQARTSCCHLSLLRTRGGISYLGSPAKNKLHSSPHTRRYFLFNRHVGSPQILFSAHAEVFPPRQSP